MKQMIFILNLLLGLALLGSVAYHFLDSGKETQAFTVKKSAKKTTAVKPKVNDSIRTAQADQESTIVSKNIFNSARNPNAQTFGRSYGQVQMVLVGVSMVGDWKGAVILQKTNNRNNRFPYRPMMGPMGTQNQTTTAVQQAPKQYIRVGETLSNGYTLTEVTRTSAVLTLGSSRMELKLQEASKNQPQAVARTNRRTNIVQQMQQMQQMQMRQNMQMMNMMRQNMRQIQNMNNNNMNGNRGGVNRSTTQRRR